VLLQQAFFFRARAECACWPCAKDAVKKGVGPGVDLIDDCAHDGDARHLRKHVRRLSSPEPISLPASVVAAAALTVLPLLPSRTWLLGWNGRLSWCERFLCKYDVSFPLYTMASKDALRLVEKPFNQWR
jgi:hypothetical protein